ncbi:MAG: ArsR family transcriptional regulator [Candidatus Bathyarchaeia archaeon]
MVRISPSVGYDEEQLNIIFSVQGAESTVMFHMGYNIKEDVAFFGEAGERNDLYTANLKKEDLDSDLHMLKSEFFKEVVKPLIRSVGLSRDEVSQVLLELAKLFRSELTKFLFGREEVNQKTVTAEFDPKKYPDPFKRAFELCSADVYGEENNLKLLIASIFSKDLKVGEQIHALLLGPPASGKTTLMKAVKSILPEDHVKEIVRMTPATLEYSADSMKGKVLMFSQLPAEQSKSDTTHVFLSEGEVRILLTVKDEKTGGRKVIEKRAEGPVAFIASIIDEKIVDIDSQLISRCLLLFPNSSVEQNIGVQLYKQKMELCSYIKTAMEKGKAEFREWYSAFSEKAIKDVINPYLSFIAINPLSESSRRYITMVNAFIKVLAYMRQGQRFIVKLKRGEEERLCVLPSPEDLKDTVEMVKSIVEQSYVRLTPQMRKIIEAMAGKEYFTRRDVMKLLGKSRSTVIRILNALVDQGFVDIVEQGRMIKYAVSRMPNEDIFFIPKEIFESDPAEILKMIIAVLRSEWGEVEVYSYNSAVLSKVDIDYKEEEDLKMHFALISESVRSWLTGFLNRKLGMGDGSERSEGGENQDLGMRGEENYEESGTMDEWEYRDPYDLGKLGGI